MFKIGDIIFLKAFPDFKAKIIGKRICSPDGYVRYPVRHLNTSYHENDFHTIFEKDWLYKVDLMAIWKKINA